MPAERETGQIIFCRAKDAKKTEGGKFLSFAAFASFARKYTPPIPNRPPSWERAGGDGAAHRPCLECS
jgi:hypothetical protein